MDQHEAMNTLRAKYRSEWDAYQVIAGRNTQLRLAGREPSAEQLEYERVAAAAVARAREELLAAIARGGV